MAMVGLVSLVGQVLTSAVPPAVVGQTATMTATPTLTPGARSTFTPTPTPTATASATAASASATATATGTPTLTQSPATATATAVPTPVPTASPAPTSVAPTATPWPVTPTGTLFRARLGLRDPSAGNRLSTLTTKVLSRDKDSAVVLVDAVQLARLARLRYALLGTDDVGILVSANAVERPALAESLRPFLARVSTASQPLAAVAAGISTTTVVQSSVSTLSTEQVAGITSLGSVDSDGDGLSDTAESWWCTSPTSADSDGDTVSDGMEVQGLKDWLSNTRASPPSSGKPFAGWPPQIAGCRDDDQDSVPDLAETWDLGLNPNRESTDRDKFDDGQELFGNTYCPGTGGFCGYGAIPRDQDWGIIFAEMPSWVKVPGNHPLVAAFPVPEVDVVPSSLHVSAVTTVTTDKTISEGTEKSYSTAKTEGTSSSVADTVTWNEWQEVSEGREERILSAQASGVNPRPAGWWDDVKTKGKEVMDASLQVGKQATDWTVATGKDLTLAGLTQLACTNVSLGAEAKGVGIGLDGSDSPIAKGNCAQWTILAREFGSQNLKDMIDLGTDYKYAPGNSYQPASASGPTQVVVSNNFDTENLVKGLDGVRFAQTQMGTVISERLQEITTVLASPIKTSSETKGRSSGGAQTTTHTKYEEHTVTNGEAFSNSTSWGTATAVNSANAAEMWFSYTVRNTGTEYAQEIRNLAFNIYIGDDPNPVCTYFVGSAACGTQTGSTEFNNFMPGEVKAYTSARLPLTLDQMRAIDVDPRCAAQKQAGLIPASQTCPGGTVRIVVEDFTYGIDELFYQDAAGSSVNVAIEDGTEDGDETIDTYLIPTWGDGDSVQDVIARYFQHETDAQGNITAIWTPEPGTSPGAWCQSPKPVGSQATLCKRVLSTSDWWNIYLNNLGDGTAALKDTLAKPNATAFFRFNRDADLDGYSDRSEVRLGTDPRNAASFPRPELIGGLHTRTDPADPNKRIATLSLLNTGLYDAYGVEAVMVSPDGTTSITNNTVGGSGRVRAGKEVIVGSRIKLQPLASQWTQPDHARPAVGGYYTGQVDRTYTFTVKCSSQVGCEIGKGDVRLDWSDGLGASGSVYFGVQGANDTYRSPEQERVGDFGVRLAMLTGKLFEGETFTVTAQTPRDTFQYTVSPDASGNYTEPLVIVSYNDPQGNHRFVLPACPVGQVCSSRLAKPDADLRAYSGKMLKDPGVEMVTETAFAPGANTTRLVVNNPTGTTLVNAKLFLEFVDPSGTVVHEVPTTVASLPPGPSIVPVAWDSGAFSPAHDPTKDYIVLVFLTDHQGNILDTAGRPLSSFQSDPRPAFAYDEAALTWDFGSAQQGTLLQREFRLASVGYQDLLTSIVADNGISVTGPTSRALSPGDVGVYTVNLNTESLPVGAFERTIALRTSDLDRQTRQIVIRGTITAAPSETGANTQVRPLDVDVPVTGPKNAGEWVDYTLTGPLASDPSVQSLQPVKVYSQDYAKLWGYGKYASGFGSSAGSFEMFGNGQDGDLTVTGPMDLNPIRATASGTAGSTTLNVSVTTASGFSPNQLVLIHQTRGTNAGKWELNYVQSVGSGELTLRNALTNGYATDSGANRAQVLWVPQYRDLTIQAGVTVSPTPWDGSTGGLIAFRASGVVEVKVGGQISAQGTGYRGGVTPNTQPSVYSMQGESTLGLGVLTTASNAGGGGGGIREADTTNAKNASGGGGGGYGSVGTTGAGQGRDGPQAAPQQGGTGGETFGVSDLSLLLFGGGGGEGGGCQGSGCGGWAGEDGGNGGGIIYIGARTASVLGGITADGASGANASYEYGGGGGGAGGSVLIQLGDTNVGASQISSLGGSGSPQNQYGGAGGAGGTGRIRVEYCEERATLPVTSPTASLQKLSCYIAEQVEVSSYTSGRLNLPENVPTSQAYKVQYGRRVQFAASGEQTTTLRLDKQLYASAFLDVLVSNAGASSGSISISLDFGNDGTPDWTYNASTSFPSTLSATGFVAALNTYLVGRSEAFGASVDVPVRVSVDRQADVLLTNLVLGLQSSSAGSSVRPLDWPTVISGDRTQGDNYEFTHTLQPEPASLQPCQIYDESGNALKGVGRYCADFGSGIASGDLFGTGRDGDLTVAAGQTVYADDLAPTVSVTNNAAAGQREVWVSNGLVFATGDEVLILQSRGTGVGNYEFGVIESVASPSVVLRSNLLSTYTADAVSKAQVIKVAHYRNVDVQAGGVLSVRAWDGETGRGGGVLAFRASELLNVDGALHADGNPGAVQMLSNFQNVAGGQGPGFAGGTGTADNTRDVQAWAGEGTAGDNTLRATYANGNGGGGGRAIGAPTRAGGGGGGHASTGGAGGNDFGSSVGGSGGQAVGNAALTQLFFGGGGGGGAREETSNVGSGGAGGGIVLISAKNMQVSGRISSVGGNGGGRTDTPVAAGGGGAGGSVLLRSRSATVGVNSVVATGGAGGFGGEWQQLGGTGSDGRIRLEYCDALTGSTNPSASTQKLTCYIAEQVESDPERDLIKLTLPETFTGGRTYQTQFGRQYDLAATTPVVKSLRINRQVYETATLQALVSNVATGSGPLNLCLDVGNDGSCEWSDTTTTTFPSALNVAGLASAVNAYLQTSNAAFGTPVDVPIRVQADRAAQVMLTDVELTQPAGIRTRIVRLPARAYGEVKVDLRFGEASTPAGALAFTVDVGADGQVDWSASGNYSAFPASLTSPNLAAAFNAYLAGRSGDVDVPIRIIPSPSMATGFVSFTAVPSSLPDASVTAADITVPATPPTEGESATLSATLRNGTSTSSGPLTASFFADALDFGSYYIGSAFVPNVPAGGSALASITWDTLGFNGPVPVKVVVDPFDRTKENNPDNNVASATATVRSRPDLSVSQVVLSNPEPVVGETVTVTALVQNAGQTGASNVPVALYLGDPSGSGTLLNAASITSVPGATGTTPGAGTATFSWTPGSAGTPRLFARADHTRAVRESDESNNDVSRVFNVGFAGSILLDSGTASEPTYSAAQGYGVLDEGAADVLLSTCGSQPAQTQRLGPDGRVKYRFGNLLPGHFYHLNLTLLECDGAGRQETVLVDNMAIAGPVSLVGGQAQRLSVRLDPALYADREIVVEVQAPGIDGAVVSEVALHDVDYRAADAGGDSVADPAYPGGRLASLGRAYGWLDGTAVTSWGTLPYQTVRVNQTGPSLSYRFDGLVASKAYRALFTFWQPSGTARVQKIQVDGADSGLTVDTGDYQVHRLSLDIPTASYLADGKVDLGVIRTNAGFGAIVNEIALEEVTTATSATTTGISVGFDQNTLTVARDGSSSLAIVVDTGTQPVDSVEVHVDFDPARLQVVDASGNPVSSLTAGTALGSVLQNNVSNSTGRIDFGAGLTLGSSAPSGRFTLATLRLKAPAAASVGNTALAFVTGSTRNTSAAFGGSSLAVSPTAGVVSVVEAATLSGSVALEGRGSAPSSQWQVPVTVSLYQPGGTTPVTSMTATTDTSGAFTVGGIVPGSYDVDVKTPQGLSRKVEGLSLAVGSNPARVFGALPTGDVDGNNRVNILDFSNLSATFGKVLGDSGYDGRADLNADSLVSILDFSLLRPNFGQVGPLPAPTTATTSGARLGAASASSSVEVTINAPAETRAIGEVFTVEVRVNAASQAVDGAEVHLDFDPAVLQVTSVDGIPAGTIAAGTALDTVIQNRADNTQGRIDFAAGKLSGSLPSGSFTLASVTLKAISATGVAETGIGFASTLARKADVTFAGASVFSRAVSGSVNVPDPNACGPSPRLSSDLYQLLQAPSFAPFAAKRDLHYGAGRVRVIAELAGVEGDLATVYSLDVEARSRGQVQALVPLGRLCGLSGDARVRVVRSPSEAVTTRPGVPLPTAPPPTVVPTPTMPTATAPATVTPTAAATVTPVVEATATPAGTATATLTLSPTATPSAPATSTPTAAVAPTSTPSQTPVPQTTAIPHRTMP